MTLDADHLAREVVVAHAVIDREPEVLRQDRVKRAQGEQDECEAQNESANSESRRLRRMAVDL